MVPRKRRLPTETPLSPRAAPAASIVGGPPSCCVRAFRVRESASNPGTPAPPGRSMAGSFRAIDGVIQQQLAGRDIVPLLHGGVLRRDMRVAQPPLQR